MTATGRKKIDELYHPVCERSEFYTMSDLAKPPVLFSPAEDSIDKVSLYSNNYRYAVFILLSFSAFKYCFLIGFWSKREWRGSVRIYHQRSLNKHTDCCTFASKPKVGCLIPTTGTPWWYLRPSLGTYFSVPTENVPKFMVYLLYNMCLKKHARSLTIKLLRQKKLWAFCAPVVSILQRYMLGRFFCRRTLK